MTGLTRYQVRLSVPWVGGWRAWGAVSEESESRLAEQQSPAIAVGVDSWVRRVATYSRWSSPVRSPPASRELPCETGLNPYFPACSVTDSHGLDL
jgi:hypothetical protein